ncbi:hypothetical protein AB0E12_16575 [Micromonospora chersina]|uniref:hypothetical protein n=1 Tax=Micromonospora chersina TaxID=47854 RepID=UPI0033D6C896
MAVDIAATDAGWRARGRLVSDEDHEAFGFLSDLDPVFLLRFEDGSSVAVTVCPDGHRDFVLTEHADPLRRSVENRIAPE